MNEMLPLLSDAFGPSGFEDPIRNTLTELCRPYVDQVEVDSLGNLILTKEGNSDFCLMLDAHMDEVGFLITRIEESGFLRFAPLGGWDVRIVPAQIMTIRTRSGDFLQGVVGAVPPHVLGEGEAKVIPFEELFIDVGARSSKEVEKMGISVGNSAVVHYPARWLRPGVLMGKALDDRAGCGVLVEVLKRLKKNKLSHKLVCVFASGEEVGMRGIQTAAYRVNPHMALSLEGTIGCDFPGVPEKRKVASLYQGPVLTVADRSIIVSEKFLSALEEIADKNKIPWQHKLPFFGSTNAGMVHLSREGVLASVMAVPCRYIHSPVSLMAESDFNATVELCYQFVRQAQTIYKRSLPVIERKQTLGWRNWQTRTA